MQNFDIHLCAYNSELKVMAAFIAKIYNDPDHPTGLNRVSLENILCIGLWLTFARASISKKLQLRQTMN